LKLFAETDLTNALGRIQQNLQNEVRAQDQDRLLNVNETQYIEYLVRRYWVEPLQIHVENVELTERERMISANQFGGRRSPWGDDEGRSYLRRLSRTTSPYRERCGSWVRSQVAACCGPRKSLRANTGSPSRSLTSTTMRKRFSPELTTFFNTRDNSSRT
jgi:hypothetical protein